jgi:ABC-2 type transport system permease protein
MRTWSFMVKEFRLILRDKGTIVILIVMPLIQLVLFGYAIRIDPKHLPVVIVTYDHSPLTRNFISKLQASTYFTVVDALSNNINQARADMTSGKISYIVTIPANFTHNFIRGENPQLLVEVDGSDPGSSGTAIGVFQPILQEAIDDFTKNGLGNIIPASSSMNVTGSLNINNNANSVNLVIHRNYNEANKSELDIIPGLIGVLLTMTMVMITASSITKENEDGTMEMLLSTPLRPFEIIIGKVLPYVVLGYLQLTTILLFSRLLIHLPIDGSLWLLYLSSAPFILANLMVGMIFSTLATTPMQAMQLSMLYQLPSMMLSGYFFSFFGMPQWAQWIGRCVPMTYYMRICRSIILKGSGFMQVLPNLLPICVMAAVFIVIASNVFKQTLD